MRHFLQVEVYKPGTTTHQTIFVGLAAISVIAPHGNERAVICTVDGREWETVESFQYINKILAFTG